MNTKNKKQMKQRNGDLLRLFDAGEFDVIIHGCNCFHAMGAGIAAQIAKRYPKAAKMDRELSSYGDINKLSNSTMAHVGEGALVVNLYTQFLPGLDLYYDALYLGFRKLSKQLRTTDRIGIPAIGCGIAGGNWNEVGPKIAEIMKRFDITYVKYEPVNKIPIDNGEIEFNDTQKEIKGYFDSGISPDSM